MMGPNGHAYLCDLEHSIVEGSPEIGARGTLTYMASDGLSKWFVDNFAKEI